MKMKRKRKTPTTAPKAITLQDETFKVLKESILRDIVGGRMQKASCDTQPP
jgi:hypothetical protein